MEQKQYKEISKSWKQATILEERIEAKGARGENVPEAVTLTITK